MNFLKKVDQHFIKKTETLEIGNANEVELIKLPHELQTMILGYLSPKELTVTSLVCRSLNDLSNDDVLWRNLVFRRFGEDVVLAKKQAYKDFYRSMKPVPKKSRKKLKRPVSENKKLRKVHRPDYPEIKSLRKVHRPDYPEKQEAILKQYNFFVLIDRSGSMRLPVEEGCDEPRWEIVKEYFKFIVFEAIELTREGVEVCFFDTKVEWIDRKVECARQVDRIFRDNFPRHGVTNLADALQETFTRHFERKSNRRKEGRKQKSIVIVITDGIPNDGTSEKMAKDKVNQAIIDATNRLSKKHMFRQEDFVSTTELGIRFFQVGYDRAAKEYLNKLSYNFKEAKVNIISTGNIEDLTGSYGVRDAFVQAIWK